MITIRLFIRITSLLIILAGLVIFLFPRFTNWQFSQQTQQYQEEFNLFLDTGIEAGRESEVTSPLPFPDLLAAMQEYNAELEFKGQSGLVDAYSYQKPSFDLTEWGVPNDIIGFLAIPAMDLNLPIYLGANKENMKLGAAQLSQTSLPIGSYDGISTNCVLAAHRGYGKAAMFRNIQRLKAGDTITITNLWGTLTYKVTETKVILPSEIDQILIQEGKDMLTLTTCHPYRSNTHRYIVYCERTTP